MGTTYAVAALASSNLPVAITVAPTSSSFCAQGGGSNVVLLAQGMCVVNANQPGDGASYAAASQVQQSFLVQSLAAGSSPAKLFGCTTSAACSGNITGLLEGFAAIEANLTVLRFSCLLENCSATPTLPWLVPCTQAYITCVLDLNAERVANFANIQAALSTYSAGCLTPQCSTATSAAQAQYSTLMESVALVCASPLCATSNSAFISAQQVFSGVSNAIQSELQRFDADLLETSLGELYIDTYNYYQCLNGTCRDKHYARVSESYAIRGYVSSGLQESPLSQALLAEPMSSLRVPSSVAGDAAWGALWQQTRNQWTTENVACLFFWHSWSPGGLPHLMLCC